MFYNVCIDLDANQKDLDKTGWFRRDNYFGYTNDNYSITIDRYNGGFYKKYAIFNIRAYKNKPISTLWEGWLYIKKTSNPYKNNFKIVAEDFNGYETYKKGFKTAPEVLQHLIEYTEKVYKEKKTN